MRRMRELVNTLHQFLYHKNRIRENARIIVLSLAEQPPLQIHKSQQRHSAGS